MVYVERLLFLEYALPLRPYHHIGTARRSRFHQHQQFDAVRQKYMVTGSPSPLEELQSLRDFGRAMSRTDPPSYFLRWSDDAETLFYGSKFSLSMTAFRGLAEYFTTEAEKCCNQLMFDMEPSFDLALIKDDLTNASYGFSFVQHPDNKLTQCYLELAEWACTARSNRLFCQGRWDWKAVSLYRKKAESLLGALAGAFHTTAGQVARASELLSLEYRNGSSTERGLYVYNGFMIYLTRHHKNKRSTNQEFNVVRFLPARVGRIVYQYLVFIQPFLDMLIREQRCTDLSCGMKENRYLLFHTDAGHPGLPWASARLTSILKAATASVWQQPVHIQLYRQLAIGITEKHVREVYNGFNRFDDRSWTADINAVFAWQTGHRPVQRATTYGLDGAFPTTLQPQLLRLYEWASCRWHEFLHMSSRVLPKSKRETELRKRRRVQVDEDDNPLCTSSRSVSPMTISPSQSFTARRIQQGCKRRRVDREATASPVDVNSLVHEQSHDSRHISPPGQFHQTASPTHTDQSKIQELGGTVTNDPDNRLASIEPYIYLSEYGLVVCQICGYANIVDEVDTHLRTIHNISSTKRKRLVEKIRQLPGIRSSREEFEDFHYPRPHQLPISCLQPPRIDGLQCNKCLLITVDIRVIQKHCRIMHGWENKRRRGGRPRNYDVAVGHPWREDVICQRFFMKRLACKWFEVQSSK